MININKTFNINIMKAKKHKNYINYIWENGRPPLSSECIIISNSTSKSRNSFTVLLTEGMKSLSDAKRQRKC